MGRMNSARISRWLIVKLLPVFLIALFMANLTFARETWMGFQAGLSLPNLKGGDNPLSQGYTSRRAPFFGIMINHTLSGPFALKTEICYSSQGGQRNGLQPIAADQVPFPLPPDLMLYADFNNKAIIDYVEIPLMLEVNSGERMKFFIDGGVYAGYRVRAKTVTSGTSLIYLDPNGMMPLDPNLQVPFDATTDISDEINRWNFGLCGALGVKMPLGSGLAVASVRFNYGLKNIQAHPEITGKNKTGALIISLGYYRLISR
ncbi:MAG: outer membrane beta-barrel protein [Candidatus Saccharicenans sp.]|nr:outer membrane beta-barrel protein [Candidatus Saccharicenans sp.]